MNTKAVHTARNAPPPPVSGKDKEEAKQCLILADKLLKEGDFEKAREEVSKAQKLDPSNPYAYAFLDRIAHFEEQKKKSAPPPPPPSPETPQWPSVEPKVTGQALPVKAGPVQPVPKPSPPVSSAPVPTPPAAQKPPAPAPPKPAAAVPAPPKPAVPAPAPPKPAATPPPLPKPSPPAQKHAASREETKQVVEAAKPVIADVLAARTASGSEHPKPSRSPSASSPIAQMIQEMSEKVSHHAPGPGKGDIEGKLDEMRRQIEMLTNALDQERRVREDMNQQQLKGAIQQLRTALEKAWIHGAPKEQEIRELQALTTSLGLPDDVVSTLQREVKLEMYSRAAKEVVGKQKLLRSSSRTLEWLRKVYQVTMDEYLEYESKFLMDLVAEQYKGTVLVVSGDEEIVKGLVPRLKSGGYAVVMAVSPENALEKIEKINPHYILCDMEFSAASLSGVKFLHVLRANSKFNYIPFILMCGKKEMTQLKSSELRPTEGYVEKPIDIENLNVIMNEKLMQFRAYLSSL